MARTAAGRMPAEFTDCRRAHLLIKYCQSVLMNANEDNIENPVRTPTEIFHLLNPELLQVQTGGQSVMYKLAN